MYFPIDIIHNIVYNNNCKKEVPMNPRKTCIKLLAENGYIFKRSGANHDIYYNPQTKTTIPVKRHDFDESDMRYILKEAKVKRREG